MKIEQAFPLLPLLDDLFPLRALLLSTSQKDELARWASAGPYLTLGKRELATGEMRARLDATVSAEADRMRAVYAAYTIALEAMERDDRTTAVSQLLEAGHLEERHGHWREARAWFTSALRLAEELQERRPEIDALLALGRIGMYMGTYEDSARHYQRALALAEGEFEQGLAIAAAQGLGGVSAAQGDPDGAAAWYTRAIRQADASMDQLRGAEARHAFAEQLRRRGEPARAEPLLREARATFEALGQPDQVARVLCTLGLVEVALDRSADAKGAFRESLAWLLRGSSAPGLEVFVRISYARLHMAMGQYLQATEELRRAEERAIGATLIARLVEIYVLMGTLCGLQRDDGGFVFFEQALQLAAITDASPLLHARIFSEYGSFKEHVGTAEEAEGYLERARRIFASLGAGDEARRVEHKLVKLAG